MELHQRYCHVPTAHFSIVKALDDRAENDSLLLLHSLIRKYSTELESHFTTDTLETLRLLLCYEYQQHFHSLENGKRTACKNICLQSLQHVIVAQNSYEDVTDLAIFHDILVLQMTLHCKSKCIEEHIINLQQINLNEMRVFSMRTIECFLKVLQLRQFLYKDVDEEIIDNISILCIKGLASWLESKDTKEWPLLTSMFPRIISIVRSKNSFLTLWTVVLESPKDLNDLFAALCIFINACLPLNQENVSQIPQILWESKELWSMILKGLESPIRQYRKQALFIMKRIIAFWDPCSQTVEIKKCSLLPFACSRPVAQNLCINDIKEKYFLIIEALEEKQFHLISPALTHLPALINAHKAHATENHDCFNIAWLQVVFQRMLQHENNAIAKQGISYVCDSDPIVLDDKFLKVFIDSLNNTILYENQSPGEEPDVTRQLTKLWLQATEHKESTFFSELLETIGEKEWGPIPLFYIIKSLRIVSEKAGRSDLLRDKDLPAIKILIHKTMTMQTVILRMASQVELLQLIFKSVQNVDDSMLILDILSEFYSKEVLKRNSAIWDDAKSWLKSLLKKQDALDFVQQLCEKCSNDCISSNLSTKEISFIILILYDCELILTGNACPASRALNKWLSCLRDIEVRPYANLSIALNAIEFISHLFTTDLKSSDVILVNLVAPYLFSTLQFLLKNLESVTMKQTYQDAIRYTNITVSLLSKAFLPRKHAMDYIQKFSQECTRIIDNINGSNSLNILCALHVLHCCLENLETISHSKAVLDICNTNILDCTTLSDASSRGIFASDCYLVLIKITYQYIKKLSLRVNWLENLSYLFDKGGKNAVPAVARVLQVLLNKKLIKDTDVSNFETIFGICWRYTFLDKRNSLFWPSVTNLLAVIINPNIFHLTNATNFISQYTSHLIEEGDNLPKLKKIALERMRMMPVQFQKPFNQVLLSCLLHGFAPRRDKKIEMQAFLIAKNSYRKYFSENTWFTEHNIDATIRAQAAILLYKIINKDYDYMSSLLTIVLTKLDKLKNKRYYNHSQTHKVKHRLMQILLLMQPLLNEADTVTVQKVLCSLILSESNQHSVRLMQEWILIRIFMNNDHLHTNLWELFDEAIKMRPGCTSSIISIVYHVAQLLPSDKQSNFILTGLKYISYCCLGQHFAMRLYGQVVLVKLYDTLKKLGCEDIVLQYQGLYSAANESLKRGNAMKHSDKLQEDFYLTVFHPIENYTLETLYFDLPRLSDMDFSEWIDPKLFEELNLQKISAHPLMMYNSKRDLSEVKTSSYLEKTGIGTTDDLEVKVNSDRSSNELSDIQKKINPSVPRSSEIFQNTSNSLRTKSFLPDEGLVVVASLIDRIPNLGGLARTCEIFGVRELIINNLNMIKDKDFQSLSVSADKWINISEIKAYELAEYLLKKKDCGWSLVGVEQTAYSTNLLNMNFSKKTILVLGNEKDGMPANLIPLFDSCVEIPQTGVIRSLNVHVTGSICIWQYAKQHVFL